MQLKHALNPKRIQNAKEKAGLFQTKEDNTTLDFEAATALNLEILKIV
jgi:hypothetical protein